MRTKKVHNPFALSAKRLAELNSPDANFCPRCFVVRNQMHGSFRDAPYSMPVAGLLSRMDSMQKSVISAGDKLPDFLGAYQGQELLKMKRMTYEDPNTGLMIAGVPDLVFCRKAHRLSVIDLKTSKPKTAASSGDAEGFAKIMSIMCGQLHVYKYLLENLGYGMVDRLSLMFMWPEDARRAANGLTVKFESTELPITVDNEMIPRLLDMAARLIRSKVMPPPKANCVDCIRTAGFLSIFGAASVREEEIAAEPEIFVP